MMMGVYEAGENDMPFEIEHFIGGIGQFAHRADLLDESAANKETTLGNLPLMVVHGYDGCVFYEKGSHGKEPVVSEQ